LPFRLGLYGGWHMMMTGRECALYSLALLLVLYIALCWPRSVIAGRGTIAQHRQHILWEGGWDNWPRDEKDGRAQLLDIDEPINSESCAPNTRRMAEHPCWTSTSQQVLATNMYSRPPGDNLVDTRWSAPEDLIYSAIFRSPPFPDSGWRVIFLGRVYAMLLYCS
jgi:hypothetical protein